MPRLSLIIIFLMLFLGCGPSAEERANLTAHSLTEQAHRFLENDLIDAAQDCAEKAVATPDATDTAEAQALLKRIAEIKYQRAWKKAQRELQPLFEEATAQLEAGKEQEAVALVVKKATESTGAQADCANEFLNRLRASLDTDRAHQFWRSFNLSALLGFEEKKILPKTVWDRNWGVPLENPSLLAAWKQTLLATLPEVIEEKKQEAARAVPQTPFGALNTTLTVPMEEISAHPENWYGKQVYFSGAWVRGGVKRDPGHGYTLSVLSSEQKPVSSEGHSVRK